MKYHTAVKFVAVILCAAALLGAVGSALGIGALSALGLYDKTVDEFHQEYIQDRGRWLSEAVAREYASVALGGCPKNFVASQYGDSNLFYYPYYSYQLKAADGSTVTEGGYTLSDKDVVATLTFPVEGKYMHLVSMVYASEKSAETEPGSQTEVDETIQLMEDAPVPDGEPMLLSDAPPAPEPAQTGAPEEVPADEAPAAEPAAETGEPLTEPVPEDQAAETAPAETAAPETEPAETAPADTAPETVPPVMDNEPSDSVSADPIGLPTDSVLSDPSTVNGRPVTDYQLHKSGFWDWERDEHADVQYVLLDMPEYTLELRLAAGATDVDPYLPLLRTLRHYRDSLLPALALSLLVFAACVVYLCCAAGRDRNSEEIRAGGLNRMPLELYALFSVGAIGCLLVAIVEGGDYLIRQDTKVGLTFGAAAAFAISLILVGFLFALAAQIKTPGWFWLKNSLFGRCLRLLGWFWHKFTAGCVSSAKALDHKVFPFLGRLLKKLWDLLRRCLGSLFGGIAKLYHYLSDKVKHFIGLLPLTWQWLVIGCAMVFVMALLCATGSAVGVFIALLLTIGAVMVGSNAFGQLLESTRRMSRGDLNARIDEHRLFGCFRDFARNLNALANVAVVAAQKQLKSERMKTELITNVSHDIKTPLTSIISYTDLLQKPHTEEEEKQYLEVLSRQSMQLKKLIEDLIEMSKASTGNMSVDIIQVDAVEAVNQALGEFDDKLEKAQLTPIFRHSEPEAPMMADGKLLWRVLHNLLSNAVKYALPGTRLYVDVMSLEGKVILSMKNVSREELNVDAEELMERFVRGDGSRKTEGSGLGLNIAKSMMELQHGSLQLLVDGDLFKVTLIFPGA